MTRPSTRGRIASIFAIASLLTARASLGQAGSDSLALSSGTAAANGTVALSLVLTSPAGNEPSDIQWKLTYPPASVVSISANSGPALTAAGKALNCFGAAGQFACLASGMNAGIISNGTVAVVNLTMAAGATTTAIGISNSAVSSPTGRALLLSATGGTVTGGSAVLPTVTSLSCLPATVNSSGNSTCTVTLSKTAPTGGTNVTLSDTSPNLTVPASVRVAAGATSVSFSVTAAAIGSDQSATLTATYNGSSANAAISLVAPVRVSLVACNPTSLGPISLSTCTVTLTKAAPTGGATVGLSNTNLTLIIPASVKVGASATSATFSATTVAILSGQSATITATYNGSSANTTINFAASAVVSSLACNPTSLAPNSFSTCTVTLTKAAPTGGATVTLSDTSPNLTIPASVKVAAAATSASFSATTAAIPTTQSATITATYNSSSANASISLVAASLPGNQTGLIGYWNFDEGSGTVAHDTSGSGHNGTVNGATWTAGKIRGALSFNGSTTNVVTPNIAIGRTFSASAWVNPAVTNQVGFVRILETQYNIGLYVGTDATGKKYQLIVNGGAGSTSSCAGGFGCAQGGTITSGWHLVTATYDGTTGKLYVDGAMVASDTFTAPPSSALPLYMGSHFAGQGFGWHGVVDDVRLYNRAVTSTEVSTLYTGLIGYWSFNEGSGSTAHDTSGSGYNGTVKGATWTAGKISGALHFNGGTNTVVTPNITLGSAFSASVWVNSAVAQPAQHVRILETRYDVGFFVGTDATGKKYQLIVKGGAGSTGSCGGGFGCVEGGTITSGWHLVTATYDGTTGRLYVDGVIVASDTFSAPANTSLPLYIGSDFMGSGFGWHGSLDEVRLYNRALTSAEVLALYPVPTYF